jgi:serine/threonine-protein kinase HipA
MPRARSRIPLNVFINSRLVGQLRKETSGAIDFQYDDSWLHWEHAFPVSLSLPLREDRYVGDAVAAVFDNLLPDSVEIRRRLAERVGSEGDDAYSLLSAIGRDCVGALQFLPDGAEPGPAGRIDGEVAPASRIAALLADLGRTPLGVSADDKDFRISIAGAQEKTALLFWKNKWHVPHGSSATTHILKPPIGVLRNGVDLSRSVENEHFCMLLTTELGLPTAKTAIATFDGVRVLVVERFDRRWTKDKRLLRVPQEDLCQALSVPPARKYQPEGGPGIREVLQVLKASDDPESDRRMFMKAQMVFWLLGATDGHAKNFSIFLHPRGGFRLTPLYDVMSLQPTYAANQVKRNRMKLAMSVGSSRHYVIETIKLRHFIQTAAQAGMPASTVQEIAAELLSAWPGALAVARSQLPKDFPARLIDSIVGGAQRRLKIIRADKESG